MERKPKREQGGIGFEAMFNSVELLFEVPTDEVWVRCVGVFELKFGTFMDDEVRGECGYVACGYENLHFCGTGTNPQHRRIIRRCILGDGFDVEAVGARGVNGEVVWRGDLAEEGEAHGGRGEEGCDAAEVAFSDREVFHGDDSGFGCDLAR